MAKLLVRTAGLGQPVLELRMGVNRVGRGPDCEVPLAHSSISTCHCELSLTSDGVYLRDCDSTNGTFLNGERVTEAWLEAGQILRLGEVELLVESTNVVIAVPEYERGEPLPPAPVILEDGRTACPRHTDTAATFRCTFCGDLMCNRCIHVIRIKGGRPHYLCRLCSQPAERLEAEGPRKKKGFLAMLQETVRLTFAGPRSRKDEDE